METIADLTADIRKWERNAWANGSGGLALLLDAIATRLEHLQKIYQPHREARSSAEIPKDTGDPSTGKLGDCR